MGYRIDPSSSMGHRISEMTLLADGQAIEPAREYVVAGWASVNEDTQGPPIYDLVAGYIEQKKVIEIAPSRAVKVVS